MGRVCGEMNAVSKRSDSSVLHRAKVSRKQEPSRAEPANVPALPTMQIGRLLGRRSLTIRDYAVCFIFVHAQMFFF